MTRISGHSSIPVKLLRQSRSAKGGVASTGFKSVNVIGSPFGTYTRKSNNIKYIVQDTSFNCGKKSFLEKITKWVVKKTYVAAIAAMGISLAGIVLQLFGRKKTDATVDETPVTPQQPTVPKQTVKEDPAIETEKTYYGGMLGELTVTGKLNNTADAATKDSTGDISQTAAKLTEQYAAISDIEITGEEGSYQAKITYKDADGKTVSKDVTAADTNALVKEVKNLMQELQTLDNDVGKAAQQIKQMYGDIISDITVTAQEDGKYSAKITIPAARQRGGHPAVKTVAVSSSQELDDEVFKFTQELYATDDNNNPFKAATAFENDLTSTEGADISSNTIDQLVQSQVDLYNAYGDGEGDISLQDMFAYEKATADKSQSYQEIQTSSKMFFGAYDANSDGQVTADELKEFYNDADADHNGKLTADELQLHVMATLEEKKGLDFDELASVRYGGNTEGPTQDKADSLVDMIKENFYKGPVKVSGKYVDYKDGQFRIADDENMSVNCKTATEDEVKKLYMES